MILKIMLHQCGYRKKIFCFCKLVISHETIIYRRCEIKVDTKCVRVEQKNNHLWMWFETLSKYIPYQWGIIGIYKLSIT